uniref:Uncharacterized protein n=1 Tax=Nelumbo nucifera TaxID=4432 RepID=A0A822YGX2_NELNU|nr:TPA_asm: hypothetical protein HUJ06_009370 [Nelumbo nucifera]
MRGSQEQEGELQQQFKNLEQEWHSYNYKRPNRERLYPHSAEAKSTTNNILQLSETSTKNVISSLRHRNSPSEGGRKVRKNDLVLKEILRDRRVAMESCKLMGRSLFDALEDASKMGCRGEDEICSVCSSVLNQASEIKSLYASSIHVDNDDDDKEDDPRSVSGYFNSSTCPFVEQEKEKLAVGVEKVEREKNGVGVEEKRIAANGGGGYEGRLIVVMGWLAILLMVFTLGIISWRSFHGYGDEDGEILIPT